MSAEPMPAVNTSVRRTLTSHGRADREDTHVRSSVSRYQGSSTVWRDKHP